MLAQLFHSLILDTVSLSQEKSFSALSTMKEAQAANFH